MRIKSKSCNFAPRNEIKAHKSTKKINTNQIFNAKNMFKLKIYNTVKAAFAQAADFWTICASIADAERIAADRGATMYDIEMTNF